MLCCLVFASSIVSTAKAREALYFIANLHALSTVRDGQSLREHTLEAAYAYLSLGLDPTRAILFRQSDVPEIAELFWILGSLVPIQHLERAHSYKDKVVRGVAANFGLFAYPVLMTADILAFGADLVPIGQDQAQHVEFARDWATRFNMSFVTGYDPQDPRADQPGHTPGILKLPNARLVAIQVPSSGYSSSPAYSNGLPGSRSVRSTSALVYCCHPIARKG